MLCVSPSLLAVIGVNGGWKQEFLLGFGESWEPEPWDCDDKNEEDIFPRNGEKSF